MTYSYQESTDKQFAIYTGVDGNTLIALAMSKENDKDYAFYLYERKLISKEEYDTLVSMIKSTDAENYEVARSVLYNIKNKNHESN